MKTRVRGAGVILLLGVGLMLGSGCALKQESAPKPSLAQVILALGAGVEASEAERLEIEASAYARELERRYGRTIALGA